MDGLIVSEEEGIGIKLVDEVIGFEDTTDVGITARISRHG